MQLIFNLSTIKHAWIGNPDIFLTIPQSISPAKSCTFSLESQKAHGLES
jgi:hypothetical protein